MKSVIVTLAKLLISGLFFFYVFSRVDLHRFVDTIRGVNFGLLACALPAIWFGHFICVLRWRILMRPLMPVPTLARLCCMYCIGLFFNLTFPTIIGGDAVKIYYAGKPSRSYTESFAAAFLDRDIGMFAMMTIACCAVLLHPASIPVVSITLIVWSVFVVFFLCNVVVFTPRLHRTLDTVLKKLRYGKIAVKIDAVAKAFRVAGGQPVALCKSFGISFANQLLGCAVVWLTALSLDVHVSPFYFLIFVPVITLISMIPISLNGMGLREYAFMSMFGAIGVADESCIALGLLYSIMIILSSLPGGIVYIFFRGEVRDAQIAAAKTDFG